MNYATSKGIVTAERDTNGQSRVEVLLGHLDFFPIFLLFICSAAAYD